MDEDFEMCKTSRNILFCFLSNGPTRKVLKGSPVKTIKDPWSTFYRRLTSSQRKPGAGGWKSPKDTLHVNHSTKFTWHKGIRHRHTRILSLPRIWSKIIFTDSSASGTLSSFRRCTHVVVMSLRFWESRFLELAFELWKLHLWSLV